MGNSELVSLARIKIEVDLRLLTGIDNAGRVNHRRRNHDSTKTIVIATGAQYRKLPLENLARFEGVGVYYGAANIEAQMCEAKDVVIVGGGNSAGQAAVFLSRFAAHVHILVRADSLAGSMSRYLIRRIEETPNITLHTRTELVELKGDEHLESIVIRNNVTGESWERPCQHVYLMTGASPNTEWLRNCVCLDDKGFVLAGPNLTDQHLKDAHWPLPRRPYLFETSIPGVFSAGDVRAGSVKRVASGVGEERSPSHSFIRHSAHSRKGLSTIRNLVPAMLHMIRARVP